VALRQISTLVAAIATALLFYLVVVVILFARILRWLGCTIVVLTNMTTTAPPRHVDAYGYAVPIGWAIALLSFTPSMWLACTIYFTAQRRYRERHGLCPECGYRVHCAWRGKCPRCGLRLGPDALTVRVRLRA
jgi:hypothetical protein